MSCLFTWFSQSKCNPNFSRRAPQTFYVSPGVYNWSADAAGVYFLQKAAQAGVPQLTAFVNSAPTTMTTNGRSCGGNLVDGQIQAYAQYLTDVIAHFRDQGIHFTHVSPMNEPDDVRDPSRELVSGPRGGVLLY